MSNFRSVSLEELNRFAPKTMVGTLGIEFTYACEDRLEATMPVDHRTHQPYGLLHGGAVRHQAERAG